MNVIKWNYGNYSSKNYGANTMAVAVGGATFYFSYDTIVAFFAPNYGRVVSENIWTTTTGKHLNWIEPDHAARISHKQFGLKLEELLNKMDLALE